MAGKLSANAIKAGTIIPSKLENAVNNSIYNYVAPAGVFIDKIIYDDNLTLLAANACTSNQSNVTVEVKGNSFSSSCNVYFTGDYTIEFPSSRIQFNNSNSITLNVQTSGNLLPYFNTFNGYNTLKGNTTLTSLPISGKLKLQIVNPDGQSAISTIKWKYNYTGNTRAYTSGGRAGTPGALHYDTIDKFPFSTNENATDVGDLSQVAMGATGFSSDTHGYIVGGIKGPSPSPPFIPSSVGNIQKFPFASDASIAFVSPTATGHHATGHSSMIAGYSFCGQTSSPPASGRDSSAYVYSRRKLNFANDSRSTILHSSPTLSFFGGAGISSSEKGYIAKGRYAAPSSTPIPPPSTPFTFPTTSTTGIRSFSFASDSDNNGDFIISSPTSGFATVGISSESYGYISGIYTPPAITTTSIEKFPFSIETASMGTVGNLSAKRNNGTGSSSENEGYASGGRSSPTTYSNVIDKFPFASDANATDVGDLTQAREFPTSQQY
jgi:hypothetical protein